SFLFIHNSEMDAGGYGCLIIPAINLIAHNRQKSPPKPARAPAVVFTACAPPWFVVPNRLPLASAIRPAVCPWPSAQLASAQKLTSVVKVGSAASDWPGVATGNTPHTSATTGSPRRTWRRNCICDSPYIDLEQFERITVYPFYLSCRLKVM